MVSRKRQAFTLMEVVLVLAVLIIVSAVSIPFLYTMLNSSRLEAGVSALRTQMTKARNRAMSDRVPYRFAIKENSGTFRIAPDSVEYWEDAQGSFQNEFLETNQVPLDTQGVLPEEVRFASANGNGSGSDWRTVTIFLPNGTAEQDCEISLSYRDSQTVTIRVQASTGAITTAALAVQSNVHVR